MTEAEAMAQLLVGAPPGTSIEAHRSARRSATVVTAYLLGTSIEVACVPDSVHHDPRGFSVDWPAVLRTLPTAPRPQPATSEPPQPAAG